MKRLENKICIVTGSSRGIGIGIARAFLGQGATVVICGSRQESADRAVAKLKGEFPGGKMIGVAVDMSDGDSIRAMVKKAYDTFGRIDVLVNNAGVVSHKSILDMSDADFDDVIRINLCGPFKCIQAVASIMKEQGSGSIINTSSMVGTYGGRMQTAYSSSKFGINGLTKSCAKELGPYGIRVNAVAPGVVVTDMMTSTVDESMLAMLKRVTPLGRAGATSELAGAYVYLASDEASFTTGTVLHVDGGIVM